MDGAGRARGLFARALAVEPQHAAALGGAAALAEDVGNFTVARVLYERSLPPRTARRRRCRTPRAGAQLRYARAPRAHLGAVR